jgi:hypothetical protein
VACPHTGAGDQPLELVDAPVHPGQLVEDLQLDGLIAPVPEIGIVGVLIPELDRQPVPLLVHPG